MKKKVYVTREEVHKAIDNHDKRDDMHWTVNSIGAVLIVGVISVGLLFAFVVMMVSGFPGKDYEVRSLLADSYSFNEPDCVAWRDAPEQCNFITHDGYCFIGNRTLMQTEIPKICLFYCHTVQVPDGEECRKDLLYAERAQLMCTKAYVGCDPYNVATWDDTRGCTVPLKESPPYEIVLPCSGNVSWCWYDQTAFDMNRHFIDQYASTYNCSTEFVNPHYEQHCGPIFSNVTTFCATPDQIAQARRLIA